MTARLTVLGVAVTLLSTVLASPAVAQIGQSPTEEQLKAAGAIRVLGDELAKMLKNNTLEHTNVGTGQTFVIFYRDDGRRFLRVGSGVRETKWWLQDDMRCDVSVASGRSVCHRVYKQGDSYRVCADGEPVCIWLVNLILGDVEKLSK